MEPLGTITKYYPFIDDESKSILNSLMDESSSYYDFVQRLFATVLENEVPINLAYLAAVQAWWCRLKEAIDHIQERYSDIAFIRPWGHPHTSSLSDQVRYHDTVVREIEATMVNSPEDWMMIELHLLHATYHWPFHGDIPSFLEPLERARNLIESNADLRCFESLIFTFGAWIKSREGDPNGALIDAHRGQKLAEIYDDSLYMYMSLSSQADSLRVINIQESIAKYEELYDLVQDMKVPYFLAETLNDSALALEAAGEYDLAIASHLEGIKIWGGGDTAFLILSRIYATLDNGLLALEWIDRAFEYVGHLEFPVLYLRKAWALALCEQIDDAERSLSTAHSMIMKTGSEVWLGDYYHISGVVELKRKNLQAAQDFFEQAYEIAERNPRVLNQNAALLGLARVETVLSGQSRESKMNVTPGKWLSRLERYASERSLTGIRMYTALLKSEFYQVHEQLKDAQTTLMDALTISDSLGVKTLRKMINDRIQELNRLLREEEMAS